MGSNDLDFSHLAPGNSGGQSTADQWDSAFKKAKHSSSNKKTGAGWDQAFAKVNGKTTKKGIK